ncbi:MAG TPA: hypothetical protein VGM01_03280 [Ktedonobacteraceae bacterium]
MQDAVVSLLPAWGNFYGIIGSAAATLTGLMFIVVTLIAGSRMTQGGEGIAAFGTPNVVHFCAALFITAVLSAPWQTLSHASLLLLLLLGCSGLGGVIYIVIVARRARRQTDYQPVLEDWLWHTVFPLVSYIALVVAALMLPDDPAPALFIIAAVTLLFLFIGIHNAWDTLTYMAVERFGSEEKKRQDETTAS